MRRTHIWRRWVLRTLACAAGLVVVVVATALVFLRSLDRPWIKGHVQDAARSAGVEIDYRTGQIAWLSGLTLDGLVVAQPAEMRRFAPDLARVEHLEVGWSLGGALLGRGPAVPRVAVSGIALTVVMDENGRTSFDALSPSAPSPKPPPAPSTPVSEQAAKYLASPLPLGELAIDDVSARLVRTDHGEVVERDEVRGLGLTVTTGSAEPETKGARVRLALGTPERPLDLQVTRAPAAGPTNAAKSKLWLTADVTPAALTTALDLRILEQNFTANVPADHWLHAEAKAQFDAQGHKTEITLDHTSAGDGAATAEASVTLPDTGDPLVKSAHGDVDLGRILRWLPAGMVPVTADRARLGYKVVSFVAGSPPRMLEGGSASIDAELVNVAYSGAATARVGDVQLAVNAQPGQNGGIVGHASLKVDALSATSGDSHVEAQALVLDADGEQAKDGAIGAHATLGFAKLEAKGPSPALLKDGHVEVKAQGLVVNGDDPLASRGDVGLSAGITSVDARASGMQVVTDGLSFSAHTVLQGKPPFAAEVDLKMGRLQVTGPGGKAMANSPMHLEVRAKDVLPDKGNPGASRGAVHATFALGELETTLDATKAADAVDYELRVALPSLRIARPFLPASMLATLPVDRMGVTLHSRGHVEHPSAPSIQHTTELVVDRVAFANVAASRVSLSLRSQGNAVQHQGDLDLRAQGLAFDGGPASDDHVALSVRLDRARPALDFRLTTDGRARATATGAFAFDPAKKVVTYGLDAHLGRLAPLAPLLASVHGLDAVDASKLDVVFSAHGSVAGVVTGVSTDGTARVAPDPARTAAVEGTSDLAIEHLQWSRGDQAVISPKVTWHAAVHTEGDRRTLESTLAIGTVHLDIGSHDVDLNGVRQTAKVIVSGSLAEPSDTQIEQDLSIGGVTQDYVPEYPVGDLDFSLSADRGPEGILHVNAMKLANAAAGTALALTGNVATGAGRRTLSVTTSLTQDLAKLSTIPDRFKGTGELTVDTNISSADYLSHCDVKGAVTGKAVSFSLPNLGVELDTFDGEVPIGAALDLRGGRVTLQKSDKRSPYSMLRFSDQHPLMTRSGYLSIARIKTPWITIAPIVGNLEIEQNVVSLRQFEMGVRNGSITGQCGVVWDGPKSTVELHVRASGVQSSYGEPFDGNIEVAISAADRTVEGRAEILRIGERHLLDLLDLQDPLHVDPMMNRVRTLLNFGYPDKLRLVFDHGFASVHLELGGLAHLATIGDMKGIPMGPIIDKMLAPATDAPSAADSGEPPEDAKTAIETKAANPRPTDAKPTVTKAKPDTQGAPP